MDHQLQYRFPWRNKSIGSSCNKSQSQQLSDNQISSIELEKILKKFGGLKPTNIPSVAKTSDKVAEPTVELPETLSSPLFTDKSTISTEAAQSDGPAGLNHCSDNNSERPSCIVKSSGLSEVTSSNDSLGMTSLTAGHDSNKLPRIGGCDAQAGSKSGGKMPSSLSGLEATCMRHSPYKLTVKPPDANGRSTGKTINCGTAANKQQEPGQPRTMNPTAGHPLPNDDSIFRTNFTNRSRTFGAASLPGSIPGIGGHYVNGDGQTTIPNNYIPSCSPEQLPGVSLGGHSGEPKLSTPFALPPTFLPETLANRFPTSGISRLNNLITNKPIDSISASARLLQMGLVPVLKVDWVPYHMVTPTLLANQREATRAISSSSSAHDGILQPLTINSHGVSNHLLSGLQLAPSTHHSSHGSHTTTNVFPQFHSPVEHPFHPGSVVQPERDVLSSLIGQSPPICPASSMPSGIPTHLLSPISSPDSDVGISSSSSFQGHSSAISPIFSPVLQKDSPFKKVTIKTENPSECCLTLPTVLDSKKTGFPSVTTTKNSHPKTVYRNSNFISHGHQSLQPSFIGQLHVSPF